MKHFSDVVTVSLPALLIALLAATQAHALELYSHARALDISAEDRRLSCLDLEGELRELEPLSYNSHPNFYEDGYQGASIVLGTMVSPIAYGLSGYSTTRGYVEAGRVSKIKQRIAVLRELKAQKHCFES